MNDKYKITPAQVFKMRMQYKAEFNNLRKTYHEVVVQKSPLGRKHFQDRAIPTTILPDNQRSRQKQTIQRRHYYSPVNISQGVQRSHSRGKRQYEKSVGNLSQIIKQKYQAKKKSLSQGILGNRSMLSISRGQTNTNEMTGLNVGRNDKSLTHIPKSCIRIDPKYHRFDHSLLG